MQKIYMNTNHKNVKWLYVLGGPDVSHKHNVESVSDKVRHFANHSADYELPFEQ